MAESPQAGSKNSEFASAFHAHLEETHGQSDQVAEAGGLELKRIKRAGMEGLVEESGDTIN